MELDFATDFATFDNQNTVSIQSQAGGDPEDTSAIRRWVTEREAAASNGKYTTDDGVFHVSGYGLETDIAIGDTITDTDGAWTIIGRRFEQLTNRWELIARQLSLTDVVTIQLATWTKSEDGIQEAVWNNEHTDLAASFQLVEGKDEEDHRNQHLMPRYRVHLVQTIDTDNRRVIHDGNAYRIIAHGDSDRVDVAFELECEDW